MTGCVWSPIRQGAEMRTPEIRTSRSSTTRSTWVAASASPRWGLCRVALSRTTSFGRARRAVRRIALPTTRRRGRTHSSGTTTASGLRLGRWSGSISPEPASPLRNAGSNTYAPATDYLGISRPQETTADIGAYEYQVGVLGGRASFFGLGAISMATLG